MPPFTTDHKFSKRIADCFRDMRIYELSNRISDCPWGGRNRIIGRIRIFERYLTVEDVVQARWHHLQVNRTPQTDENLRDAGMVFLNKLMFERSRGKFWEEIEEIAKQQPSVADYAWAEYAGRPRPSSVFKRPPRLKLVSSDPSPRAEQKKPENVD